MLKGIDCEMSLQELFDRYGYLNITHKDEALAYKLFVELFYDDGKIPKELKYLYISKTCDELFVVLDGRNKDINELCKIWDQKISIFIAFGSEEESVTQKLKYNVIQIILCNDAIDDRSEEGSLNVSRKILLPCIIDNVGNIIISDAEVVEIPFYIVHVGDFEVNLNVMNDLMTYIPDSNTTDLDFLNKPMKKVNRNKNSGSKISKSFTEEQFKKVKEWLDSYDYSDN